MALFLLSLSKFNSLCGGIVWEKVVHAKLSKGKILLNSEMNWRRQIRLCIKHITEDGKKHQTFEILKLNLVQFGGSPGNLSLEAALLGLGWSKLGVELLLQTESPPHLLLRTCQLALHILRLKFVRIFVRIFLSKEPAVWWAALSGFCFPGGIRWAGPRSGPCIKGHCEHCQNFWGVVPHSGSWAGHCRHAPG